MTSHPVNTNSGFSNNSLLSFRPSKCEKVANSRECFPLISHTIPDGLITGQTRDGHQLFFEHLSLKENNRHHECRRDQLKNIKEDPNQFAFEISIRFFDESSPPQKHKE
ncbi:hypothetical protein CEXT_546311 [Caerostris extrusa]|uniref:Uncharacterized protein n=1 Tax=Caerostris extrusa TaxID=172846 RepID=A0AAV4TYN7_CAEEX|nr:hypothetical protein CEXT_546311 [Caerostris extrusa]